MRIIIFLGMLLMVSDIDSKKVKGKTYELEVMDVKGLIQKPSAYYVLNASDVDLSGKEEVFPAQERALDQLKDVLFDFE